MTVALVNWRLEFIDWVALVVIVWMALAIVAAPPIGKYLRRQRRRQSQPKHRDEGPLGYRPPRD